MKYDFVIVGSGINSLIAAALLSRKKYKICILERCDWIGGCIKTEEVTLPGFHHDVFSGFHPLFVTSPAYKELADELHENGLEYVNTAKPTAAVLDNGENFILTTSRKKNLENMAVLNKSDADGYERSMSHIEENDALIFGLLGSELWKFSTLKLLLISAWKMGVHSLFSFFGASMDTCRNWLDNDFTSARVKACFAPWILHTGLGPDSPLSGLMGKLICFTLEIAGMPIVKGGSHNLVKALVSIIKKNNGTVLIGQDVKRIITDKGIATGVETQNGDVFYAKNAVICNVTPTQLYGSLLKEADIPSSVVNEAETYHYGNGNMQIHLALDCSPEWYDQELNDVAMIHLTSGINSISKSVNQAQRGLLPDEATVVVAQPTALDPSRAPEGKAILWIQLQELPYNIKGDAAGKIRIPNDGKWDDTIKEAYADRIINRLAVHIPSLKDIIIARHVLSPKDLEQQNINLQQGDPYSGSCNIGQFMLWRPLKSTKNHSTPIKQLYHIGASTHPGPGLAGSSGFQVSQYF